MKNLDPKIAGPVAVVVILLALFAIARMAGVGSAPPSEGVVFGPESTNSASGASSGGVPGAEVPGAGMNAATP